MRTALLRIRYESERAWYGLLYFITLHRPSRLAVKYDAHGDFQQWRQPWLWIMQHAWIYPYLGTFEEWCQAFHPTQEVTR